MCRASAAPTQSGFGEFKVVSVNGAKGELNASSNETLHLSNSAANGNGTCFALQPFSGSGQIIARIHRSLETTGKTGLVFRENTNTPSRYAKIFISGNNIIFERLLNTNESPITTIQTNANPEWLRIVREGNALSGFYSNNGTNWTQFSADTLEMPEKIFAGFVIEETSQADFEKPRMTSAHWSSPGPGAAFVAPVNILLKTDVASFGGKVEKVEFFYGTRKIGERIAFPYAMTWSNALAGPDLIFAKVTDESGAEFFTESVKLQIKLPPTRVKFLGEDSTTQGNWKGHYGGEGFIIPRHQTNLPRYVQGNFSLSKEYIWTDRTADKRVLLRNDSEERIASFWSLHRRQEIELSLTDGNMHRFAIYFLDWNRQNRVALVEVIDLPTGKVLDSREVSSYSNGKYLVWSMVGRVKIRITPTRGYAYPAGLFFDPEQAKSD